MVAMTKQMKILRKFDCTSVKSNYTSMDAKICNSYFVFGYILEKHTINIHRIVKSSMRNGEEYVMGWTGTKLVTSWKAVDFKVEFINGVRLLWWHLRCPCDQPVYGRSEMKKLFI